jgi:hypothetical protein
MQLTRRPRTSLKRRREERELFFWTAFKALRLVIATAVVVYVVVSLIEGELPVRELLLRSLGG